jgi:ABC-type uncharacterized transport system involved in gliding motility auxiliary subunit
VVAALSVHLSRLVVDDSAEAVSVASVLETSYEKVAVPFSVVAALEDS